MSDIGEVFDNLLGMSESERKAAIKEMTAEDRSKIIDMMCLPKNTSQKRLCAEIEETARFIRIARGVKGMLRRNV